MIFFRTVPLMDFFGIVNCTRYRVLHMDTSPDGSTVVSAAADETLRFWDMFGSSPHGKPHGKAMEHDTSSSLSLSSMRNLR